MILIGRQDGKQFLFSGLLERISAIRIQDSQPAGDVIPFC